MRTRVKQFLKCMLPLRLRTALWRFRLRAGEYARARLKKVGLAVFRFHSNYMYVPDYYGHSAHKHMDIRLLPKFGFLADESIRSGKSQLYYDRLYTIYQALSDVVHMNCQAEFNLAEVGVYREWNKPFYSVDAEDFRCAWNLALL